MAERNRQRVRSHAMRHYHRQALDSRTQGTRPLRENEFELNVSPLLRPSEESAAQASHSNTGDTVECWPNTNAASQTLNTNPGSSFTDPFFQYPIMMGRREHELYEHLFDQTCVMFRTMQNVGFLTRVRQTAAFCQLLAMSSWHLEHLNERRSIHEHLKFSLSATKELQKQINDPLQCCSDEVVGAVLLFACCANLLHDYAAWNTHIHGLQLILDHRGGLHTLDTKPVLRLVLHWSGIHSLFVKIC
ncbi:hypothetical protein BCR34DRAFT_48449 [Clohesyomyces aquaticus]|uniref:Fungal-specific transcription factor domain-domain-containing protein n=1 Tax=Clohesyomyces aquaticus TaxID=1231657 RepID=A0A1Y1Z4M7_9PLEO|nr:hypothetical protein BCR34DRAFT_48449 [Clohesyomyces aquaticus]